MCKCTCVYICIGRHPSVSGVYGLILVASAWESTFLFDQQRQNQHVVCTVRWEDKSKVSKRYSLIWRDQNFEEGEDAETRCYDDCNLVLAKQTTAFKLFRGPIWINKARSMSNRDKQGCLPWQILSRS